MAEYCVNKVAQANGDHEVHEQGCQFWPAAHNRQSLGNHPNCASAVREARRHFTNVNGCFYCARPCHTQ